MPIYGKGVVAGDVVQTVTLEIRPFKSSAVLSGPSTRTAPVTPSRPPAGLPPHSPHIASQARQSVHYSRPQS